MTGRAVEMAHLIMGVASAVRPASLLVVCGSAFLSPLCDCLSWRASAAGEPRGFRRSRSSCGCAASSRSHCLTRLLFSAWHGEAQRSGKHSSPSRWSSDSQGPGPRRRLHPRRRRRRSRRLRPPTRSLVPATRPDYVRDRARWVARRAFCRCRSDDILRARPNDSLTVQPDGISSSESSPLRAHVIGAMAGCSQPSICLLVAQSWDMTQRFSQGSRRAEDGKRTSDDISSLRGQIVGDGQRRDRWDPRVVVFALRLPSPGARNDLRVGVVSLDGLAISSVRVGVLTLESAPTRPSWGRNVRWSNGSARLAVSSPSVF